MWFLKLFVKRKNSILIFSYIYDDFEETLFKTDHYVSMFERHIFVV